MQPYFAAVKQASSHHSPVLINRFSHLHLDQDSYKVLSQSRTLRTACASQRTKSLACISPASLPVPMTTSPGYWELRREAGLMNARGKWEEANQRSAPTEPTFPWVSAKDLRSSAGKEMQATSHGTTVLGKPIGVVLPSKGAVITDGKGAEHVVKPILHQLDALLSPIKSWGSMDSASSSGIGYGGGSGGEAGYGFGVLKAARQKLGGAVFGIVTLAFFIMFFFSFMYWFSQSIGVYAANASFTWIDYFWFSVRSFVTMSSPDMGPTSSWGRMLTNAEGLMGMIFIIVLSLFLGEKLKRFLGE